MPDLGTDRLEAPEEGWPEYKEETKKAEETTESSRKTNDDKDFDSID